MRLRKLDLPPEVSDDTFSAFLRFYQLETWTREMVYLELKASYGPDWWSEAEGALKRARVPVDLAKRYFARDKRHPHLSTAENDPLWFISFDSLLKIVFDSKLWRRFESYFTTKRLLRVRLEEILPIRNRVAHCRSLHTYDVERLNQFLRDFDQGFWRFCTSYSDRYYFRNGLTKNEVYRYFENRKENDLNLLYSVRPYLRDRVPKPRPGSGFVYDITIVTRHLSRFFDYERILKYTQSRHKFVLHVMLDSFQHNLRITFPSTVTPTAIIESIERFEHVAHNNYSIAPLVPLTMQTKEEQSPQDSWLEHEARNRPFQVIASRWPHYVVPPSHPFTFLDGECPCSFFGQ